MLNSDFHDSKFEKEMEIKTKTDLMNAFRMLEHERQARKEMGDNRPLNEKLKEAVREVTEFSLLAGMSNIARSEFSVKVMWILCHLCLLGVFVFLVTNNIITYLKYGVVTKVRDTNEFPSYFPVITICNLNYFQTNESKYFLEDVSKTMKSSINQNTDPGKFRQYLELAQAIVIKKGLNKTDIQKFGYDYSEMILNCFFNQKMCNLKSDISWFFHPNYGNCYQYNVGKDSNGNIVKPKQILRTGSAGGLSLEVFVGISKDLEGYTEEYGLAVFIHSNTTSPLSVKPIAVYPKAETNIVISRLVTEKEPNPYSDCEELESVDSDIKEAILKKGIDYYQQDCIIQCYQQKIIDECQCFDIRFVNYLDSNTSCNINQTQSSCYSPFYEKFLSEEFIEAECMPKCPLECKRTDYIKSISMNGYPTVAYEDYLLSLSSVYDPDNFYQPIRDNVLKVNIYYDSLSYTHIVEEPAMDTVVLVSNIGGSLGLMLGISFATMIELFELSLKVLLVCIRHKRSLKRVASAKIESVNRIHTTDAEFDHNANNHDFNHKEAEINSEYEYYSNI